MDISKRILLIRERQGVTQSEIARLLGIEQSNYSRLEKRGNKITIEQAERIAEALGVSLWELLDSDGIVEKLEREKQELQQQITAYAPLIQLVNLLSSDTERLNNFAEKVSQGGVKRADIEEQFPEVKEKFEIPKRGKK